MRKHLEITRIDGKSYVVVKVTKEPIEITVDKTTFRIFDGQIEVVKK